MKTSSWAAAGTITRAASLARKRDLRRQRHLEAQHLEREDRRGDLHLHTLGDRDDEHQELADEPPAGWARSGR